MLVVIIRMMVRVAVAVLPLAIPFPAIPSQGNKFESRDFEK